MFDYTPEGIKAQQNDIALSYLHLMDKKLKKINGKLRTIAFLGMVLVAIKCKGVIEEQIKMKGE